MIGLEVVQVVVTCSCKFHPIRPKLSFIHSNYEIKERFCSISTLRKLSISYHHLYHPHLYSLFQIFRCTELKNNKRTDWVLETSNKPLSKACFGANTKL